LRAAGNRKHEHTLPHFGELGDFRGFNTSQFPIFLLYNTVMSFGEPNNLNKCCIQGFHDAIGSPLQTYSAIEFDTTHLFGPGIVDTSIAGHEVGECVISAYLQIGFGGHCFQAEVRALRHRA
jgi:hypothetical protein